MNKRCLVALDQGTTSSRAVVFSLKGEVLSQAGYEFVQHYPRPGWVEHDPEEILESQVRALQDAVAKAGIAPGEIAAIGITNQRETTLVWDRETGRCIHPAIVWQCRRSAGLVDRLRREGAQESIREKTGLTPDAYFSGTKLQWMLRELSLGQSAAKGGLCFGTVDSFLARRLLQEEPHVTDATNASRTMLFNLQTQDWDGELLRLMEVPRAMLPRVLDSAGIFGHLRREILGVPVPVTALAGDQHAALFGQGCLSAGGVKNTYGTGCFMLMHIGEVFRLSQRGLLTTMACRLRGRVSFALEGSVFTAGAAIQWLRDELGILDSAAQSEALARSVADTGGVYLVPAFTGLGAPYWEMYARGTLVGLTRGTTRAHLARAALESIAFQSLELFDAMAGDAGEMPGQLRVDGGASANDLLMQLQADLLGIPIVRPRCRETTALGAALLAGCGVGLFDAPEETLPLWQEERRFEPGMDPAQRGERLQGWQRAVRAALAWAADADGRPVEGPPRPCYNRAAVSGERSGHVHSRGLEGL